MKFDTFRGLFLAKYPEGEAAAHGTSQHGNRVSIAFSKQSKVYEYSGAYEDILCKVGILVCSKQRLHEAELTLKHYKEMHGKSYSLFAASKLDYSKQIEELETYIANIKLNYTII